MSIIPLDVMFMGLGNFPSHYANSPHNAGFMFLDYAYTRIKKLLKERLKQEFANSSGASSISSLKITEKSHKTPLCYSKVLKAFPPLQQSEKTFMFVYPQTYMNNSGQCLLYTLKQFAPNTLVIAFDDLDIPLGNFKITTKKVNARHNGVKSILESLKNLNQYPPAILFVRIGVASDLKTKFKNSADYLLTPLPPKELDILRIGISRAFTRLFSPNILDINKFL